MPDELKKDSVDSRKEVLDLLKDLLSHYGTYHNHKENVGWAGVALFAILMAGVATTLRQRVPQTDFSCIARGGISLVVEGACVVCWLYVHKQFALRRRAADLVAACIRLRSQVVSDPNWKLMPSDWAPPTETVASGMQSTHVLPKAVRESADQLASAGQTSRRVLEYCAYAILLGLGASLLIAIWIAG
jgi:hypothetical protein